jgi:hypothetical protein
MPFLFLRTASVLAAGFLLAGPSAPSGTSALGASRSLAADTVTHCPAHWATNQYPSTYGQPPAGLNSQIMSIAALSPTDVWMLITRTDKHKNNVSDVYHLAGTQRRQSVDLDDIEKSFGAKWIVARSDTDVWVIGSAHGALEAWHYNGSSWTDHPPARYSYVGIDAAALGSNGTLYLAGNNRHTHTGAILSWDGARWADVSPPRPPYDYKALAVTAEGTVIAAGGGRGGGALQERLGPRWITVSLSAPVNAISRISVAPGGTVYGVGSAAGNRSVLIKQLAGRLSASVTDSPSTEQPTTFANKTSAALGMDVWLLGEDEPHDWWHHHWITHDNSGFMTAIRRMSQVANRLSSTALRSDQPCWPGVTPRTEIPIRTLPGDPRCGWSRREHHGMPWWHRTRSAPDSSRLTGPPPAGVSPRQPARAGRHRTPSLASPRRPANRRPARLAGERRALFTPSPASAPSYHAAWTHHFECQVHAPRG